MTQVETSKFLKRELTGLVLKESALSTPYSGISNDVYILLLFFLFFLTFNKYFSSGQINALPAYEASICNLL